MTIVTHEFDKIHSSYNNRLKYNKLIPFSKKAVTSDFLISSYNKKIETP